MIGMDFASTPSWSMKIQESHKANSICANNSLMKLSQDTLLIQRKWKIFRMNYLFQLYLFIEIQEQFSYQNLTTYQT